MTSTPSSSRSKGGFPRTAFSVTISSRESTRDRDSSPTSSCTKTTRPGTAGTSAAATAGFAAIGRSPGGCGDECPEPGERDRAIRSPCCRNGSSSTICDAASSLPRCCCCCCWAGRCWRPPGGGRSRRSASWWCPRCSRRCSICCASPTTCRSRSTLPSLPARWRGARPRSRFRLRAFPTRHGSVRTRSCIRTGGCSSRADDCSSGRPRPNMITAIARRSLRRSGRCGRRRWLPPPARATCLARTRPRYPWRRRSCCSGWPRRYSPGGSAARCCRASWRSRSIRTPSCACLRAEPGRTSRPLSARRIIGYRPTITRKFPLARLRIERRRPTWALRSLPT